MASKQTKKKQQKNKKLSNKTNQVRMQVTLIYEHSCSVDESAGCKDLPNESNKRNEMLITKRYPNSRIDMLS